MSTPITDAVADVASEFWGHAEVVSADVARGLETDRAALMEALERIERSSIDQWASDQARSALTAAKANFPQP